MRGYLVLAVLAVVAVAALAAPAEEKYTTKYDNVDLDEILNNQRLYSKYLDCLKGGKCTPDGKELKEHLPDALKSKCAKCSAKQRAGAEKVMKFIYEKKPEDFAALEKIYDPEGVYRAQYKEEAAKRGIKL